MKKCSKCGQEKALSEFYFRKDSCKYREECKQCIKDSRKKFYDENSLAIRKRVMENHVKNREARISYVRSRYHSDLEKSRNDLRLSYDRHKEKRRDDAKSYRQLNPEKAKALRSVGKHRRRSAEGKFTASDIIKMLKDQENQCVYCKIDISLTYHVDHKTPICRGGTNHLHNLQLLCPSCNMRKHSCDHETFLKRIGIAYGNS